jgi:hypothetical protein
MFKNHEVAFFKLNILEDKQRFKEEKEQNC